MEKREKTYVEDVARGVYDIKDVEDSSYKAQAGLNAEIIREISAEKKEPEWMLEFRLKSLAIDRKSVV